jgi:hypothetical protein
MHWARYYYMKRVFTSPDSAQVGLLLSILDSADIPCEMRNEAVSRAMVGLPFAAELWVLRDEDYDEATRMISKFNRKSN